MDRVAQSAAVATKAKVLAVAYLGDGRFAVASGSEPGKVHTVAAPYGDLDTMTWTCSCPWAEHGGKNCSHVQAAAGWLARHFARRARAQRRAERQAVAA